MKPRARTSAPDASAPAPATTLPLAALAGFAVAALAIRLVYLAAISKAPFFTVLMGDSRGYDLWARRIAAGDWIGADVFYQAPLYPYFMGIVYRVFGHDVYALRICQAILGSLSCALVADTASRLFSKRAGIVSGVALALYPPAIFFDGLLQKTALDAFLTALSLWLIGGILIGRGRWGTWLALGAAMGALALTRENALVLAVVLLVWSVVRFDLVPIPPPRLQVKNAAAFLAGLALLLMPVTIRNYAVTGGFYLTTSQFGPNLYLGNNARTDGTAGSLIAGRGSSEYERQDAVDIAERAAGRVLTPAEVSSYWTNQTLDFISTQPASWVSLMWRKTVLLWNRAEAFDTESQESYAEWWPPLGALAAIGHFGVLVPLACLGVAITWTDRRRLSILYLIVVAYGASVVLFFIYARYRFPLVPFLLLFAAVAIADGWRFLRARSPSQRAQIAAVLAAVIVFTNWPLLSGREMRSITEHNLGAALQSDGKIDAAIDHYRRAVAINPDYVPAYSNLGAALLSAGRDAEAITSYQQALERDPEFADAHFNLGNALLRQNRPGEAIAHFERALKTSPAATDIHTNLGLALIADNQIARGLAELETALRLSPRSAVVHRALGEALGATNRRGEAGDHLRQAVSLAPEDPEARYALGRFLLEEQRPAEAIEHLRAAVQGLAAVEVHNDLGIALAMTGRSDEAIEQFRQALRLQPTYAEARRNLDAALAARGSQR